MKILYTTHQFLPDYSAGTEILTYSTAKEISRRGHEAFIFTGYPVKGAVEASDAFDRYEYEGLSVDRFFHSNTSPVRPRNPMEAEYNNLFYADFFRERIREVKPDLVHFYHLQRLSASAIDVCREMGIPSLFTATDFWPVCPTHQLFLPDNTICDGPEEIPANCLKHLCRVSKSVPLKTFANIIPDSLIKRGLRIVPRLRRLPIHQLAMIQALMDRKNFLRHRFGCIDKVTVSTRFMARVLEAWGIEPAKIVHLPFAVTDGAAKNAPEKGREKSLRTGFIGTLLDHKGAHVLLTAIKRLGKDFPITIHIYGDPDQFPGYTRRLRYIAGDDPRIRFMGTFPNDRIGDVFDRMDLLVVPSLWHENTPLVIHSAQQAGVPVVGSNVSGIAEIIRHEENGMIFEKGDAAGLADVLLRLHDDRDLLRRLVKSSKPIGSIERYVDNLLAHYRELVSIRT